MGYQTDREDFLVRAAAECVPTETARLVLRDANTVQRLAVAECNGDWPCDNGERKVKPCAKCESGYHRSALDKQGVCPSCRAGARIVARLAPLGVTVDLQGDPRGACVKVRFKSGRGNSWGDASQYCVPTRNY